MAPSSAEKPKLPEILGHQVRVEDTHHHLLAKRGGHGRNAQLHLAARRRAGLDAAILRPALLGHVHAREDLDARGDGRHHRRWQLEYLVHHAVDAETHPASVAARLQVDVRGALLERVLQQPIDDMHDVAIVGTDFAALAQLHQLLEVEDGGRVVAGALGVLRQLDRALDTVELQQVAIDVQRIGHHAPHVSPNHLGQVLGPGGVERFAGGERHLARSRHPRAGCDVAARRRG